MLSHYDAVIWYTGEDIVTREPGWGGGNASRLAMDQILEVRDFLNEGGRCSTPASTPAASTRRTSPTSCTTRPRRTRSAAADPDVFERCRASADRVTSRTTSCSTGSVRTSWSTTRAREEGLLDVLGVDTPFTGLDWGFNGADSAENQDHSNSFITTSGILDPDVYPQFESWVASEVGS